MNQFLGYNSDGSEHYAQNAQEYLKEAEYYMSCDPMWDETLDYIIMLPEVGEALGEDL